MKTRIVFSLLSFTFFSIVASSAVIKNEGPVGQVRSLEGTGMIKRASGQIIEMTLNELIYEDDEVTINGASRANIVLKDNSTLTLAQHASLKVDSFVYTNKTWSKYGANPWMPIKGVFRFISGQLPASKLTPADSNKLAQHAGIRG